MGSTAGSATRGARKVTTVASPFFFLLLLLLVPPLLLRPPDPRLGEDFDDGRLGDGMMLFYPRKRVTKAGRLFLWFYGVMEESMCEKCWHEMFLVFVAFDTVDERTSKYRIIHESSSPI